MSDENPFGGMSGQYAASVQYGAPKQAAPNGAALPGNPGPAGLSPDEFIKDTTTARFAADVVQESRRQPVLVDFWAPWCGPCKQLAPMLEKAVRAAGGRVRLVKMNIDEHPAIAGQLGIQSIPAVIAFRDGQPVDGFMGAVPESQIEDFIRKLGGEDGKTRIAEALAAAQEARAAGDMQTAADIYDAVLQQAPGTVEAIEGLATLMFDAGDSEGAEAVLAQLPDDAKDTAGLAALRARMALAVQAGSLGDAADLERRVAENPKDFQARFDLAMAQNAMGERGKAADNLLAIVKADRSWNDDGARSQLLQLFEAWGMTDEATLSARRKLSSLLFS